ncbi:MAG: hypothetical protein J5766_03585 [Clostridia bacterium]|nr:hypothetical protein [Clostridia bacterium]
MMNKDLNDSSVYDNLKRIIKSRRIPHAFLIEGSTKEKRMETAMYIAGSVVCTSDDKPCGVCTQCKTAENGSNPDISFIVPAKDKKMISVDQIRDLRSEAIVMPHSAERRVFIIEDALQLNEQGQNALLKILEEPPKTVVFILLVPSKTSLLDTVVSRCSIFLLSDTDHTEDETSADSKEFLSLLFENREYDMLCFTRKYENDRTKARDFLDAIKDECLRQLKTGDISNYRAKILSNIYDSTDLYCESIITNVNLTLLFTAMVCKFKSFVK